MQYNLIFDTNVIKEINGDLTKFNINKTYYIVKEFIKNMGLTNIKIFIPRIILEELIKQYRDEYYKLTKSINDKIKDLNNSFMRVRWNVKIDKEFGLTNREYKDYIRKSCDEFIRNESGYLNIIENPSDNRMSKIIERAINKRYPFFGDEKNNKKYSDAGFKDTIFLESILERLEDLQGQCFIITQDEYLKRVNIEEELKERNITSCKCKFSSLSCGDDIVKELEKLLNVTDISKYIVFCRGEYYKEYIEQSFKCRVINFSEDIDVKEEEEFEFAYISTKIEKCGEEIDTVVKISDSKEFIAIYNAEDNEVLYQW